MSNRSDASDAPVDAGIQVQARRRDVGDVSEDRESEQQFDADEHLKRKTAQSAHDRCRNEWQRACHIDAIV